MLLMLRLAHRSYAIDLGHGRSNTVQRLPSWPWKLYTKRLHTHRSLTSTLQMLQTRQLFNDHCECAFALTTKHVSSKGLLFLVSRAEWKQPSKSRDRQNFGAGL